MNEIPIIRLKKVLDGLLNLLIANQASISIPTDEKFLYRLFYGNVVGKYDCYTQAAALISRDQDEDRRLETRMVFDPSRAQMPTIHIHIPADNQGRINSSGLGIGSTPYLNDDDTINQKYSRSFIGQYDLIITSINPLETLIIYEILMSLLIAGKDTLDYYFASYNFAGKDLLPNNDIMPPNVFMKAVTMKIDYNRNIPSLITDQTIETITFEGDPQESE